jgi:hypothetical protein
MSALADWARFPEDDLAPPRALAPRTSFGQEPWIGGLAAALAYLIVGVAIIPRYGEMVDSVSRAANAFFVLFSHDPHLGAIGFVWMPLPSLLALPLVALKNVWPGLVQDAVALNIISALFGGIAVFFVLRLLRRLDLPAAARRAIAVLFALNPPVVFYAANGMTDLMMAATLLGVVDGLWAYLDEGYASHLVASSGLWLAVGELIRYEITFWALVVAVTLAVSLGRLRRHERPALCYRDWMVGLLLVWMTPLCYVVALWLFLNWTIMHDPFYFQHGAYGNGAAMGTKIYAGYGPLEAGHGHIGAALAFVARQTLLFPPVIVGLLGLLGVGLAGRREQRTRALVLVAATLGLPLFHLTQVYAGNSSGWLRFFLTFIPFGFVAVAYVARLLTAVWGRRRLTWLVCIAMLLAGNCASGYELLVPSAAPSRTEPFGHFMAGDRAVRYLNAHPRLTVLADSWQAFPVIVSLHQPGRIVTTSDPDFQAILAQPLGRIDAFLVPQPVQAALLDAVNRRYPTLWAHGAPWAHLVATFPGQDHFRLYAIGAPGRGTVMPPGVTHRSPTTLYFAEVYTGLLHTNGRATFEESLAVHNTTPFTATLTITYLFPHGSPLVVTRTIGPHATRRESVNTDLGPDKVAAAVVSSAARITAARVIRRVGAGGATLGTSRSFGNASLGTTFYFAQGYSNAVSQEYLAVANPGSADAHVRVTLSRAARSGAATARDPSETFTVPAHACVTRTIHSDMWRAMAGKPVGLIVRSDQPIVAERLFDVGNGVGSSTDGATASALKRAPGERRHRGE